MGQVYCTVPQFPIDQVYLYTRRPCPSLPTQDPETQGTGRRAGRPIHRWPDSLLLDTLLPAISLPVIFLLGNFATRSFRYLTLLTEIYYVIGCLYLVGLYLVIYDQLWSFLKLVVYNQLWSVRRVEPVFPIYSWNVHALSENGMSRTNN